MRSVIIGIAAFWLPGRSFWAFLKSQKIFTDKEIIECFRWRAKAAHCVSERFFLIAPALVKHAEVCVTDYGSAISVIESKR